MRYGVIPTRLSERIALWFNRVPLPIADCLLPLLQTRALMATVRLGIADAMGDKEMTAAEIAGRCGLDADTLDMLLRVLVSARYVALGRRGYRLSAQGRRTLLKGGDADTRGYVLFNYVQWKFMERLEQVLRTGQGIEFHEAMVSADDWASYQEGMLDLARTAAPILARLVPVPRDARLLVDIGGSHGLLGAAICRAHPPMRSIVVELPAALEQARKAAERARVTDIVEHRAGNVTDDGVPGPADVVLLANIVHHFAREEAIKVLQKACAALVAGGTIAIWDFDRPVAEAAPELAADASALYFRLTSTSQVVPGDEYAAMLREAGLRGVAVKRSVLAPVQVLVVGRK